MVMCGNEEIILLILIILISNDNMKNTMCNERQ